MKHRTQPLARFAGRLAGHRGFPGALFLAAIILMLPALPIGLLGDDLIQRLAQLKPADLPPRIADTGFVPPDAGELGTVLRDLFGYLRRPEAAARARDYGIAPWWAPAAWQAALWRPVTAFTHWVDYRLFPHTPLLMHAHNIAWYAAAVFLAAICYRRIGGAPLSPTPPSAFSLQPSAFPVALAACLFLLDKNTYGPVAYVANRGFFVALVFGLACLYAHDRWRVSRSRGFMWLSAICLLLALLANEGGASTLAFLIAYALVLEPEVGPAVLSLVPAAVVVVVWRAVYAGCGFGVRNFIGYIDPGYAPGLFLKNLLPRMNALLGGQLTGIPPEINFALSPTARIILAAAFAGFSLACAFVFLPTVRRDRTARFWAAVMLLALVPAATVAPLSKNLGFVAVGAFGVIAAFLRDFASRPDRAALSLPRLMLSWGVAIWLVLAHIPGALAARAGLAVVSGFIPAGWEQFCRFSSVTDMAERDVVIVNDPSQTAAVLPFDWAYRGRPLPGSIRTLAPGLSGMIVSRPDASTLVLTAKGTDLFECPPLGPLHVGYAVQLGNDFLFGGRTWKTGDRVESKGFAAKVLELSAAGVPRAVAFQFTQPLDPEKIVWLYFDWSAGCHRDFALPQIGGTTELAGPRAR